METFKLSEKYEASYTARKVEKGWLAEGEIWTRANGVRTGLTFRVRGTTEASARKNGDQSVDYTCGNCETILLHAELDQIHNLTIRCTKWGSYNSTDV